MVTPLIPFVKQLRIYPHILFTLRVYRTFLLTGLTEISQFAVSPRFRCVPSVVLSYFRGFPVEYLSSCTYFRGFLADIFLCVLNVGCTYYRGFPAVNIYLRD